MPRRDILIFDLDGTLIDSMAPLETLFCDMLTRRCGIGAAFSRPIFTALLGSGPRAQFEAVLRRAEALEPKLLEDMTARYWEEAEQLDVVLFSETLAVLTALKQAGHALVISSGGVTASVLRKARLTGIDGFFRLMLGSDEGVPYMAKGPGHLRLIAGALGLSDMELRDRGVFIGDAAYDMRVGRAADLLTVGRLTGNNSDRLRDAGAGHLVADLHELEALLARHESHGCAPDV